MDGLVQLRDYVGHTALPAIIPGLYSNSDIQIRHDNTIVDAFGNIALNCVMRVLKKTAVNFALSQMSRLIGTDLYISDYHETESTLSSPFTSHCLDSYYECIAQRHNSSAHIWSSLSAENGNFATGSLVDGHLIITMDSNTFTAARITIWSDLDNVTWKRDLVSFPNVTCTNCTNGLVASVPGSGSTDYYGRTYVMMDILPSNNNTPSLEIRTPYNSSTYTMWHVNLSVYRTLA